MRRKYRSLGTLYLQWSSSRTFPGAVVDSAVSPPVTIAARSNVIATTQYRAPIMRLSIVICTHTSRKPSR